MSKHVAIPKPHPFPWSFRRAGNEYAILDANGTNVGSCKEYDVAVYLVDGANISSPRSRGGQTLACAIHPGAERPPEPDPYAIAAAYVLDRVEQYDESHEYRALLTSLAFKLRDNAREAHAHGELDDILARFERGAKR